MRLFSKGVVKTWRWPI